MTAAPAFTARSPEDVLALAAVVLGFVPDDSVAMLTFGSSSPFHARVDLPRARDEIPEMVGMLLDPARRHGVRQVVFVVYTDDRRLGRAVAAALAREFDRARIDVVDVLRADGERWYVALGSRPGVPEWGVPYDLSAHPFIAQSVLDGRVTHGSREELRATLATDHQRVGRVVTALAALTGDPPALRTEGTWAAALVSRHVRDGTVPDDAEVARLLHGMLDVGVRDAAWSPMRRADAAEHVRFWIDVVRRSPQPLLAAPAALLAFAAWQAGQGALAWCALDRVAEVDEGYSLAGLVTHALTHAVPPTAWDDDPPGGADRPGPR